MDVKDRELLDKARETILKYKDDPGGMEIIREMMNGVYRYFKFAIPKATFEDKRMLELFIVERELEDKFLPLESEPIFDAENPPVFPSVIETEEDCEKALACIVHKTREKLNRDGKIKTSTLEKMCYTSAGYVESVCEELGVDQKRFSCETDLSIGLFHCFNVVSFELPDGSLKMYLVDCTYRQFFTYADSFVERIGIPLNEGGSIGAYTMMDESRKKMAEGLLTKGYMEFSATNIKQYFDGFVFAGRNGLYYEQLGKDSLDKTDYEPSYTYMDYLQALNTGGLKKEQYMGRQFGVLSRPITFDSGEEVKSNKNSY